MVEEGGSLAVEEGEEDSVGASALNFLLKRKFSKENEYEAENRGEF